MPRIPENPRVVEDPDVFLERHNRFWGPGGTAMRMLWLFMLVTSAISIIFVIGLWKYSIYSDRDVTMMLIYANLVELWLEVVIWEYVHVVYKRSEPTFGPLSDLVGIGDFITELMRPATNWLEDQLLALNLKIDWGLRK